MKKYWQTKALILKLIKSQILNLFKSWSFEAWKLLFHKAFQLKKLRTNFPKKNFNQYFQKKADQSACIISIEIRHLSLGRISITKVSAAEAIQLFNAVSCRTNFLLISKFVEVFFSLSDCHKQNSRFRLLFLVFHVGSWSLCCSPSRELKEWQRSMEKLHESRSPRQHQQRPFSHQASVALSAPQRAVSTPEPFQIYIRKRATSRLSGSKASAWNVPRISMSIKRFTLSGWWAIIRPLVLDSAAHSLRRITTTSRYLISTNCFRLE